MSAPPSKWTRRDWIRASLIAGAAAGAGAVVGATAYSQLFPPTSRSEGELRQSFVYLSFPEDVWWNRFGAGRPRNGFPGLARRLGRVERSIQGRQLGVGDRLSGPHHPFETGRPVFPGADRRAASGRVLLGLR